ncbi:MAG: hypothetical protein KAJ33_03435 [Thermoplasmata archaeon]|nr:hypothetical protein [Thermoplasmata archaeon]
MAINSTTLIADLLATIFQDNKTLLLELKIDNVIAGCKREHPVLEHLVVTDNLVVNPENLPDNSEVMRALGSMVFTIGEYLEVFVGAEESNKRIGQAVRLFKAKYLEDEIADVVNALPEIFAIGASGTAASVENFEDLEKVKRIFLQIYAKSIEDNSSLTDKVVKHLKACKPLHSVSDDAAWFEFNEGTGVTEAIDDLSTATESMDLSTALVETIIAGYGDLPEELGIVKRIFNGAFSDITTFGVKPIDGLLRDGISRDDTLILKGPAGVEKDILSLAFLKEGLDNNGCGIVVSSRNSPSCIRQSLESAGVNIDTAFATERLIFVDWHSRYTERVTSIDESLGMIKVSNDLTNLAVGIDLALRKAKAHSQKRLVLDMASTTIVTEGFERVHDFLNSVRAKLKNAKCTGLVLLNPDVHTMEQVGILDDVFDGTLLIHRTIEHGKAKSSFRITGLSGGAYSTSRLSMEVTDRGLLISGDEQESQIIPFDNDDEKGSLGLPGIESISAGGLPVGRSFLVWLSTSIMPVEYVKPVLMGAQKEGHAILLALSSINSDQIGDWMSEQGLSRKGLIDRGLLQIVDWFGQKGSKVLGMEVEEGIIRTSKDVTHLGVGMDYAFRQINDQVTSMAVLEVLSPALRLFDIREVYAFAQSMQAKLSNREFTSFVLMERDAHDSHINAALEEVFDGIIDIRTVGDTLEIGIISVRGSHFQPEYRILSKMRDKLTVDVARNITESEIVDSMRSQGLASQLSRMEKELSDAVSEKQNLEKRMKELMEREVEYEKRHNEMKETISKIEAKMTAQKTQAPETHHDPKHKEELTSLLAVMDEMLEKLPEDVIQRFAESDDFKLYEKIMDLYLKEIEDD